MDHLRSGVSEQPDQHGGTPISTEKYKKVLSWVWWCMPVIPATWEAQAGESLELRRQRFWRAEIVPLHSCLSDGARLCLKKKRRKKGRKEGRKERKKIGHFRLITQSEEYKERN